MHSSPPAVNPKSTAARTGLGRQAAPAVGTGQAPSHLDGGEDLGQEVRHGQAGPPDHRPAGPLDHRLDPEAVVLVALEHRCRGTPRSPPPAWRPGAGTTRTTPRRGSPPARRGRPARTGRSTSRSVVSVGMPGWPIGSAALPCSPAASPEGKPGGVGQRGVAARDGPRRRRAGPVGTTAPPGPRRGPRRPRPRPRRSRRWSRAPRTATRRRAGACPRPAPGRRAAARPTGWCGGGQPWARRGIALFLPPRRG